MSINAYQIFATVAEQGNFLKASGLLNITPSAVSHSIAGLEQEFGYPLFTRSRQGVTPTSYGESLMPYIRAVLNREAVLQQEVAALNGLEKGLVRLGCFSSICCTHLPGLVEAFHGLYPNIRVQLYQGSYDDVISWLKNGVVELGFLSTASAENKVPIHPVYQDELVCVVPENFPVRIPGCISHEEIKTHEFIAQQESTDSDIQTYLSRHGIQVKIGCYVSDDIAAVSLVSSGFGICIMPGLVMRSMRYSVDMYSLDPKGFRTIGVSCMDRKNLSPAGGKLYDFLIEAYESQSIPE